MPEEQERQPHARKEHEEERYLFCVVNDAFRLFARRSALMLGSDKSRGYTLEMICADFLAGAALAAGPEQNSGHSAPSDYSFA